MVDSLFGKPLGIASSATDPNRRAMLSELLRLVIAQNGGVAFLQQIALLGSVYGFVDILVKLDPAALSGVGPVDAPSACGTADLGRPVTCDDTKPNEPTADIAPSARVDATGGVPSTTAGDEPSTPASDPPVTGPASDPVDSNLRGANHTVSPDALSRVARLIRLEIVEPTRALPVLSPTDVRSVEAYAQVYTAPRQPAPVQRRVYKARWIDRVKRSATGLLGARDPRALPVATEEDHVTVVDVLTSSKWQRYEDGKLVASGTNTLGTIPLVHVQNVAEPFAYEGAGDVEPLVPLQDELNIRLSDRANRITLQSFKMYLGKGIETLSHVPMGEAG